MNYYNDIKELIGNTPLLKLNHFNINSNISIFAKLEHFNPGGSVKDRIGLSMIKDAEEKGLLKTGSTIIEATAGNTGIGIATAALNKGYRVIFTVPEKFSVEKTIIMKALGAEVVITPKEEGMSGAIEKAEKLKAEIDNSISLHQFENESNPNSHYETTGKEIYEALEGQINFFIAGAGSGGTVSGVSRYLKEQDSSIRTIVAEPLGSTMGGGEEGSYLIEGIGNNFIPSTTKLNLIDEFMTITDEEAFYYVKELARREGLIVGSSSGAVMAAAIKVAEKVTSGNIVIVLPDRGDRYFSKNIYE